MSSDHLTQQHDWTKKHFSIPPYCYLCKRLICDIGKMANYCNICHIACHFECNPKYYHMPSFCSLVKHEWVKDQFDTTHLCCGCNNTICSPKLKASGFSCSRCSLKVHKTCRNLSPKCEAITNKSSIFSNIRKSSTYLFESENSSNNSNNNSSSSSSVYYNGTDSTGSNSSSGSNGSSSSSGSGISLNKSMWTNSTPCLDQSSNKSVPKSLLYSVDNNNNNNNFEDLMNSGCYQQQQQQQYINNSDDIMLELESLSLPISLNSRFQFIERMKQFFINLSFKLEWCSFSSYSFDSDDLFFAAERRDLDDFNNRVKYRSIAEIFHHQMIGVGKLRTQVQFNNYRSLIEAFLILFSNSWCEKTEPILRLSLDFYKFLCTHKIDPENVLIGMTPSKDIQRRIKKYFYISEQIDNSSGSNSSNNSNSNNSANRKKTTFDWDFRISRVSLIENINAWSLIENKDLLQKTIREFSKHLEKEKLQEGDIIIAKLPKNWSYLDSETQNCYFIQDPNHHEFDEGSFIFGRYYKEADSLGLNCLVHLQPDEVKPLKIPFSRIVSLKMIDITIPSVEPSRIEKLERFITNPFDAFISEFRSALKDSTKYHLMEVGLDVGIISKGLNFDGVRSASLEDLILIRDKITSLEVPDFLQNTDQLANDFCQYFTQYLKKVYITELNRNYQVYYYQDSKLLSLPSSLISDYNILFNLPNNLSPIKDDTNQESISSSQSSPISTSPILINNNNNNNKSGSNNNNNCKANNLFSYIKKQFLKFKPFLPTLRNLISDIESSKKFAFKAKDSLNTFRYESDLAIENIKTYNSKLLDGSKKKELTGWYLQLIKETIESYLKQKGYDPQAVPENYIDRPPDSLSKVKENLRMVNLILKPSTPKEFEERLQNLINPLKKKIYNGIDEFLSVAEILLDSLLREYKAYLFDISSGLIDLDGSCCGSGYSEEYLKSLLSLLKNIYNNPSIPTITANNNNSTPPNYMSSSVHVNSLTSSSIVHSSQMIYNSSIINNNSTPTSPLMASTMISYKTDKSTIVLTLSNLIDDVLYIREMKQLEDKYYSNEILLEPSANDSNLAGGSRILSNIVPITGLLFSRLLRLKHEIRTVLEVWLNKDIYNFNLATKPPQSGYSSHGVIIGKKDEYIKENRDT